MNEKPPLPQDLDPWPRITVDTSDGSPFAEILRIAYIAADGWTFGPDGPYQKALTNGETCRMQLREGLLHLQELGLIDIDVDRLNAAFAVPVSREP